MQIKNLTIILCLVLLSGIAYAQDSTSIGSNEHVQYLVSKFDEEFDLDRKQKQQLRKVLTRRHFTLKKELAKYGSPKEKVGACKIVNQRYCNELEGIFTEDQWKQFVVLRAQENRVKKKFLKEHPEIEPTEEDFLLEF